MSPPRDHPMPIIIALVATCTILVILLLTCNSNPATAELANKQPNDDAPQPPTTAIQNATTTATNTTNNEPVCSGRMAKGGPCKPCTCDPVGSQPSHHCDPLTRRCICRPGYTGNLCNKCSDGYFNETRPAMMITTQAERGWQCQNCGLCYQNWHEILSRELKEPAVEVIKRASKWESSFTKMETNKVMVAAVTEKQSTKVVRTQSAFEELEHSIGAIGDCILRNKQASDQANLISDELNSTLSQIHRDSTVFIADYKRAVAPRVARLDLDMSLHFEFQRDLAKSLEEFKGELVAIQEFMPAGSIKSIKNNRNRTRRALAQILEQNKNHSTALDKSLFGLELALDQIRYSQRQMAYIGSQILNETLTRQGYSLADLVTDHHHLQHPDQGTLAMTANTETRKAETARTVAELSAQLFEVYSASFDNRTLDMAATRKQIEEAKGALLQAKQMMTSNFDANLTSLQEIVADLNGTGLTCDFEQLLENATHIVRASLDKIDVRWPAAAAAASEPVAELDHKLRVANETTRQAFANLTLQLNAALGENLPNLVAFKQAANLTQSNLADVAALGQRTKLLAHNLDDLGQRLIKLADLKSTSAELQNRTRALNANVSLARETYALDGHKTGPRANEPTNEDLHEQLRASVKSLAADSRSALERARHLQAQSFGRKLTSNRLLGIQIELLTNSSTENKRLALEVQEQVAELSTGLLIATDGGSINTTAHVNSTRIAKLSDRRRVTNAINDLRSISRRLQRGLLLSGNLSAEFAEYERSFAMQRDTIESLHKEMDTLNADLKRKSDFYENCQ